MNVRKCGKKTRRKCFKYAKSQGQELNPHYGLAPPPLSPCITVCACVYVCVGAHGTNNCTTTTQQHFDLNLKITDSGQRFCPCILCLRQPMICKRNILHAKTSLNK